MTFAVIVKNLVKDYDLSSGVKFRALDHVSFHVKSKEIFGVLGQSGSGKTTLLRILRGVEPFNEGEVIINGVKLTPNSSRDDFYKVRKLTAIHMQRSFGLWPERAIDNVVRALAFKRKGYETIPFASRTEYEELEREALKILRLVNLENEAAMWAEVLSGGQKQKLLLARQLARGPSVLLLDEPGTMVSPKSRMALLRAIKEINRRLGVTVIYSSHMPEVHRRLADRLMWLHKGRVVEIGDPNRILERFMAGMERALPLTPPEKKIIMKVDGVSKEYHIIPEGKTFLMKKISFNVYDGEILAIIGPSAAGKTVLIRLMSGLELPNSGSVKMRMDNRWVSLSSLGYGAIMARRNIGILHKEFDLPYWAKIKELFVARLGLKSRKYISDALKRAKEAGIDVKTFDAIYRVMEMPRDEAETKLARLGLSIEEVKELFPIYPVDAVGAKVKNVLKMLKLSEEVLDRKSYELSWGEKLRVALALLLVHKPKLLLLDEPFGDLDTITLRRVANTLKELNKKSGVSIVLVSHQLDFIREVAHRAILIVNGKLMFDGAPDKACSLFQENFNEANRIY